MTFRIVLGIGLVLLCPVAALAGEEAGRPGFSFGLDGLSGPTFGEEDRWLHIGGRLALDLMHYDRRNVRSHTFELDDARLRFRGRWDDWHALVEPDLVGNDTLSNLYDAWLAFDFLPEATVRAGRIRVARGSEYATREEALPFAGYGFTSYLDGRYDLGVGVEGEILGPALWAEGVATVGHGFDLEGNRLDSPLLALRTVVFPFEKGISLAGDEPPDWISGFFGGIALSWQSDYDDRLVLTNPYESTVFLTRKLGGTSGSFLHWEFGYRNGPVRVGLERAEGNANGVPTRDGGEVDMDQLTAWVIYGSVNLTGEAQIWRRGGWRTPEGPRSGRIELAVRYSNADIDRRLFEEGLTSYDPSTQEVRTFHVEIHYEPVENLRLSLGYLKTIADHELSVFGGSNRDSSFHFRIEMVF